MLVTSLVCGQGQDSHSTGAPNRRFPYSFSNFVWWDDASLRAELKRRIPGLGLQLNENSPEEARVRTCLIQLLKERNIRAEVLTIEPPNDIMDMQRDPDAPPPSIRFQVTSPPRILIKHIVLESPAEDAATALSSVASSIEGKPYDSERLWLYKHDLTQVLGRLGYLSSAISLEVGTPEKNRDEFLVTVTAHITPGPLFHVGTIEADGGPLLPQRDLSRFISIKPGDVASSNDFGRLATTLRSLYWQAGYADVKFDSHPALDSIHGLVSYRFQVDPGPLYHLRSLTLKNLTREEQENALAVLNLRPGDIYDSLTMSKLGRQISDTSSALKGYEFTFNANEDKANRVVDLTLTFYKKQ